MPEPVSPAACTAAAGREADADSDVGLAGVPLRSGLCELLAFEAGVMPSPNSGGEPPGPEPAAGLDSWVLE
jgi:hypothetical protein